jgi:N-formylglutamate deformylase
MRTFPVFISIPHGGTDTPVELKNRVVLQPADLFHDSDAFSREIYHPGNRASNVLAADIARAFVDLNRAPGDLPPGNPDGLIKSTTCYGKRIYKPGHEPDAKLINALIESYYLPYHRRIGEAMAGECYQLALDCHTMAEVAPQIAPDTGNKRPLICLGNQHGKTCRPEVLEKLAECFCRAFELDNGDVTFNEPFAGGFITRKYGNKPCPWIQVEMNRSLYLASPWFRPDTLTVNPERLEHLNEMFVRALEYFFSPA